MLLLAITVVMMLAQSTATRAPIIHHHHRQGIPSQSTSATRTPAARVFAWSYIMLATVLPLVALLWAASSAFVTANPALMHLTTQHFAYVLFGYPKTWLAVR
jgi:hypothetical protein